MTARPQGTVELEALDRVRTEIAAIKTEIDPTRTRRRAAHWLSGARHVLNRIDRVLNPTQETP